MIKNIAAPVCATAIAVGVSIGMAGPASAVDNVKPFGQQETINDWPTGGPAIGYTVTDLRPSSDPIPHNGELYQATLTVDGFGSPATPMIPMFASRAESSAMYRVIANAGPGPVPPGGNSTGTLYFDVVGDPPVSVVYNDGVRDLLAWIPGPQEGGTRP
jgi:hypothetical protein